MSLTCGVLHLLSEVGGGGVVGYTVRRVKVVVALEGCGGWVYLWKEGECCYSICNDMSGHTYTSLQIHDADDAEAIRNVCRL